MFDRRKRPEKRLNRFWRRMSPCLIKPPGPQPVQNASLHLLSSSMSRHFAVRKTRTTTSHSHFHLPQEQFDFSPSCGRNGFTLAFRKPYKQLDNPIQLTIAGWFLFLRPNNQRGNQTPKVRLASWNVPFQMEPCPNITSRLVHNPPKADGQNPVFGLVGSFLTFFHWQKVFQVAPP